MSEQDVSTRLEPGAIELQREVLKSGYPLRIRLFGSSMTPWIRPGDVAIVRPIPWTTLRRGEVILYERDCRLFAHRLTVAPIDEDSPAVTRGDTLLTLDPPVRPDQFMGRIDALERNGRLVSLTVGWRRWTAGWMADLSVSGARIHHLAGMCRRRLLSVLVAVPAVRSRRRRSSSEPVIRSYTENDLDSLSSCLWPLHPNRSFAWVRDWTRHRIEATGSGELREKVMDRKTPLPALRIVIDGIRVVGYSFLTYGDEGSPPLKGGDDRHETGGAVEMELFLRPLSRGQGWGERLIERAEREATEAGARELAMWLPVSSTPARPLLRKRGWERKEGPSIGFRGFLFGIGSEPRERWIRSLNGASMDTDDLTADCSTTGR